MATKAKMIDMYHEIILGDKVNSLEERLDTLMETKKITSGYRYGTHSIIGSYESTKMGEMFDRAAKAKNYTQYISDSDKYTKRWFESILDSLNKFIEKVQADVEEQESLPFEESQMQLLVASGELVTNELKEEPTLTENEQKMMKAITEDDFYENGTESTLWTNVFFDCLNIGLTTKQAKGVLGSLNKKGLVNSDGECLELTETGAEYINGLEEAAEAAPAEPKSYKVTISKEYISDLMNDDYKETGEEPEYIRGFCLSFTSTDEQASSDEADKFKDVMSKLGFEAAAVSESDEWDGKYVECLQYFMNTDEYDSVKEFKSDFNHLYKQAKAQVKEV